MISATLAAELFNVAEWSAPKEMCGMLFGEGFILTVNTSDDPLHNFEIAPEEYLKACMIHDGKPSAIVHSHPTGPAFLSVDDCRLMDALEKTNHDLVIVIVSLHPREIRAFKKLGHVYQRLWEIV